MQSHGVISIEPFLERLRTLQDLDSIYEALSTQLSDLGFSSFAYHVVRPPGGQWARRVLSSYPWSWLVHYDEADYANVDPVVDGAARSMLPFKWDEILQGRRLSGKARRVFNEARDFGLRNGITVPIHGPEGGIATFNFSGDLGKAQLGDVWRAHRHDLHLIAHYAHDAILRCVYSSARREPIRLTERERECLLWTARGKTAWEVAQIMTVSYDTVLFHVRNAMAKLDVHSKHHAVVKAILFGLIVP